MKYWFCMACAIAIAACSPTSEAVISDTEASETAPSEASSPSGEPIDIYTEPSETAPTDAAPTTTESIGEITLGETTISRLVESLGYVCQSSTVIDYTTQKIESPDGKFQAYGSAQLTKEVSAEQMDRQSEDGYCFASQRTTRDQTLVIEQEGQLQRVGSEDYEGAYVITNPVAISPDSRYLASQAQIEYIGNHVSQFVVFHDLVTGQRLRMPEVCDAPELELVNFVGFTDAAEALVSCDGYAVGSTAIFETVDLNSGRVTRLDAEPSNYTADSGTRTGTFAITSVHAQD